MELNLDGDGVQPLEGGSSVAAEFLSAGSSVGGERSSTGREVVEIRRVTVTDEAVGSTPHGQGQEPVVPRQPDGPPRVFGPGSVAGAALAVQPAVGSVESGSASAVLERQDGGSDALRMDGQGLGRDAGNNTQRGNEGTVDRPPGLDGGDLVVQGTTQGSQPPMEVQVNPFWSPERKAYERMSVEWQRHVVDPSDSFLTDGRVAMVDRPHHPEFRSRAQGSMEVASSPLEAISHVQGPKGMMLDSNAQGSVGVVSSPPKAMSQVQGSKGGMPDSNPETPQKGVEMDPVELFRLRCLREAEEKFRLGVEYMLKQQQGLTGNDPPPQKRDRDDSSQTSFVSVASQGGGSLGFTSPPPPGPPPPTPPRDMGNNDFTPPPPPPHYPPVPPLPSFDGSSRIGGFLGENPNESLRTFDLPRLPVDASPLQFGDWWSMMDAHMGDLSYSSSVWWGLVKQAAESCYKDWLVADPLEKLRLKPRVDGAAANWPRTERRALAMLLQSVPDQIRGDLIAARKLSVDQVLFKLLTIFQPGGALERTRLLQCITDSRCGETGHEVLEWIRTWRRQATRAMELHLTLPDPLVLIGALTKATEWLSSRSPQVAYRLNQVRQQLGVDQQPNFQSVWAYTEHLQAEAEEMVIAMGTGSGSTSSKGNPPKAGLKSLQHGAAGNGGEVFGGNKGTHDQKAPGPKGVSPVNAAAVSSPNPCKFWCTDEGCRRADKCKFVHSLLGSKDNRCFNCSGVGHTKKECPHLLKDGKKVAKTKVKNSPPKSATETTGTSAAVVEVSGQSVGEGKDSAPADGSVGGSSDGKNSVGEDSKLDSLLQEASMLMKSLRPSVKGLHVKKAAMNELATGLLDGGATNALRVGTVEELSRAVPVTVELAAGSVQLFQDIETGTLLTDQAVEPIMPLKGLIALGFRLKWDDRGCSILHPQKGHIRTWLRNGCPVVTESDCLQLIKNWEDHERLYRMGPKLASGKVSDSVSQWWHQRFPEVPQRIVDHMVGQDHGLPKGGELPWNRRTRKRIAGARGLIIHLFSGNHEASKKWTQGWPEGVEVLTVDVASNPQQDLNKAPIWAYLVHLVKTQRILGIVGGPPCRTTSRLRNIRPGPPPLRGRSGFRFGLDDLSARDQLLADLDASLMLKMLALLHLAEEHRCPTAPRVGFGMESPEDPAAVFGEEDAPSFWAWREVEDTKRQFGLTSVSFDQGEYGHVQRKPTTLLTNLPLMSQLHGARCQTKKGEQLSNHLPERFSQTASWSSWAPGLKQAIRVSLMVVCHMHGLGTGSIKRVLDVDQWKQHILQGHVPYRRDCRACVLDMAAGKPHRRNTGGSTASWSMSIDAVQMPLGVDEATGAKVKYMLVATVAVPQFQDPKAETEGSDNLVDGDQDGLWGEGLEEPDFSLDVPEDQLDVEQGEHEVLFGSKVPPSGERPIDVDEQPPSGDPSADDVLQQAVEVCSAPISVQHVTMMHPMASRHSSEVIHGLNLLTTRYAYLGIHVARIHSDRAKEFLAKPVQRWLASKAYLQTMTDGDNPASNARAEAEVLQVKRRVRLLLRQSHEPVVNWPSAARYATEQRMRSQLKKLGCAVLPMLPFHASVAVKRKRWHNPGVLAPPFVEARILCPSPLMTSGWVVRTPQGQIFHAREAILPSLVGDQVAMQLQEQSQPPVPLDEVEHPQKPRFRAYGKQPDPRHTKIPLPAHLPGSHASGSLDALHGAGASGPLDAPHGAHASGLLDVPSVGICDVADPPDVEYTPSLADSAEWVPDEPSGGESDGGEGVGVVGVEEPRISKMVDQSVVRRVDPNWLCGIFENHHQYVLQHLGEMLNQVPMGGDEGMEYGRTLERVQRERESVEQALQELDQNQRGRLRLCGVQSSESIPNGVHVGENGEVLQTVVVSLDDVRKDIKSWVPAMLSEYRSLTEETGAIEPVDVSHLDDSMVEYVPGKLVCTVKAGPAGGRKKCRGVICGNHLSESSDPVPGSAYASGADGPLIRAVLHHGVQRAWGASIVDIKTAFLLAPRPVPDSGRETIVVPPKILVAAGVIPPTERWRVKKALYGFTSSPARWAGHRDATLRTFKWVFEGYGYYLQGTPEVNLWRIMKQRLSEGHESEGCDTMVPKDDDQCAGHLVVYVDDLLMMAPQFVREGFLARLKQEWNTSTPETVSEGSWVRFAGFELRWRGDSLRIAQPSYTQELLERHGVKKGRWSPMPDRPSTGT